MTTDTTDSQKTFRAGSAFGRQVALGETLRDLSFLIGTMNAGGTVTIEQLREWHDNMQTAYKTADATYRELSNIAQPSADEPTA